MFFLFSCSFFVVCLDFIVDGSGVLICDELLFHVEQSDGNKLKRRSGEEC